MLSHRIVVPLAVLAACLAGCAGPSSRSRPPTGGATVVNAPIEDLLADRRYDEAVDLATRGLAAAGEPAERALLELLRAQALAGDGRVRSAVLSFQRALRECPEEDTALLRRIHQGWGDAEVSLGHGRAAAERYEAALACGRLSPRQHDDLCYAAYVALRQADDPGAGAWKSRISRFSESRLAAVEQRLLPRKPEPAPAALAVAGPLIPDDPRALLAAIHPRADWGATAIRGDYDAMTPITRLTIHHTALEFSSSNPQRVASELRQLQANHQEKWADLGYHFVIDPGGGIWEGRALRYQGAHEGSGLNQGSIGVCLMGNFERRDVPQAQLGALAELLAACSGRFGLSRTDIKTHREVRPEPTECPGDRLQRWVDAYRRSADTLSLARQ